MNCTHCGKPKCEASDGPEVNLIRLFQIYPEGTPGVSNLEPYNTDRVALWLTTIRARAFQTRYIKRS